MVVTLNPTHDPTRRSWIESAEREDTEFPLQNLPYGVFRRRGSGPPRIGVAIGDAIFDLRAVGDAGVLPTELAELCRTETLNRLTAAGSASWSALRRAISELLGVDTCPLATRPRLKTCLVDQAEVELLLPAAIGDFSDFYASIFHATNVGAMFRPECPLTANYPWMPIAYHGRASSIVVSGTPIRRPRGQLRVGLAETPDYAASQQLDYELELGWFVGPGNQRGDPIPIREAGEHLFGAVLLNDWSARDIQAWEYRPLGPFLGKSFATSISPWIVTTEALAPFRIARATRAQAEPAPLDYLNDDADAAHGAFGIELEALLSSQRMREDGLGPQSICRSSASTLYWTPAQFVAHHTSNGCNLRPGDLLGTGTVSGAEPGAAGCLLELTRRGTQPLLLPTGESRAFLADGDEVVLRGFAERSGFRRIGWGSCQGTIAAAH